MTESSRTTTTCERQVCALTDNDTREMRPCVREAGHNGVCRYSEPWWRTADNPECAVFCNNFHDGDEFRQGGGMLCIGKIETPGHMTVEVQQYIGVNGVDRLVRDPATVYVDVPADVYYRPEHARILSAAVLEAALIAEDTNR